MCVEMMNNEQPDSRGSGVTSEEVVDGDVKIEVMVTTMGNKHRSHGSSAKRVHSQMIDEDLACLDWKKKKNDRSAVDDETQSVVGKSVDNAMNADVLSTRFSGMLGWLMEVAKDPCDKKVGSLPEWSKRNCRGSQEMWKQVLLAREVWFVKRSDPVDSKWQLYLESLIRLSTATWVIMMNKIWQTARPNSIKGDSSQKTHRMHPYMYGDQSGYSYCLRDRFAKKFTRKVPSNGVSHCSESNSSGDQRNEDRSPGSGTISIDDNGDGNLTSDSSTGDSLFCNQPRQRYRLGSQFQAEVPKWNGLRSENDSKWLGTQVWPLLKPEWRNLIERDPIGKSRQDSCGCASRGSVDCVQFHITEKRFKLKMELGSAFFFWRFDKMGKEAILPWTKREEDKFSEIVRLNPSSELKCFWDELVEAFPGKRRQELVGYYYNVFLLKQREHQNRHSPRVINSDDDETESSVSAKWTNSIFYSPAKPKSKSSPSKDVPQAKNCEYMH